MIDTKNFQNILKVLGFIESDSLYVKKFEQYTSVLKVDFKTQTLIYPKELKVNDKTTSNFSAPENFVVFECVHRLLSQGYHPKHLELEKKWQLGHSGKSGKADIVVKDNSDQIILIIECKTAGSEYKKAINILENDSQNQLFSYLQQATSTKFLALYASDFIDGKVLHDYYLINVTDNKELLKNNPSLRSYKNASTVEEKYQVWCKTYQKEYATVGLFENSRAYEIGKSKYSVDDLKSVSSKDIQGKYHQFATILRQHNISGRENAFDKLVNLLLCKVTDEIQNPTNLKFYYKGVAYDDPFSFLDRLQELYKIGMEKFLDDKIVYIGNNQIDDAFGVFKDKPNVTKDLIKEYFKELKFFTNSDFAFIDVHNEKLFYQNFEVLLKVAKTFEDIRLTSSEENQFLGDMFEGFLDQGVKQSEGQFFTPMPIVKFIINSLPKKDKPKVCDYACGAGHFLNEYANINKNSQIVGIEKEYRLSKVAKVSSFMYGHEIDIVYSDALKSHPKIEENSYDIIISNPPYSVKGFLTTIEEEQKERFELIADVDTKSYAKTGAIECFFIERTKQLLKGGGIGAIIVPSSILNKDTPKLYTTTREILLKYFKIIAIAEFGSGTFGKTGTNTVTLFLQKRDEEYLHTHYKNMIDEWFGCDFGTNKAFRDEDRLRSYCEYIEVDFELYKELLCGKLSDELLKQEKFQEYKTAFEKSTTFKELKKKKYFKELSKQEQESKIQKELIKFIKRVEKDKLFYFMLSTSQSNKVVIIKSPTNNNEIKKFLGYEWSNRKGDEGIKYLTKEQIKVDEDVDEEDKKVLEVLQGIKYINTPLYNPQNIDDTTKINKIIKDNFEYGSFKIADELKEYVSSANLTDMLDFSRVEFNKAFNLNPTKKVEIKSRWELVRLGEVAKLVRGVTYSKKDQVEKSNNQILTADNIDLNGNLVISKIISINDNIHISNEKQLKKDDIFICLSSGSLKHLGKVALISKNLNFYSGGFMGIIRGLQTNTISKFIFELLMLKHYKEYFESLAVGSNINNLSSVIENLKIPLPPLDIQEKIVKECEEIDEVNEKLRVENGKLKGEIERIIKSVEGNLVLIENILTPIKGDTTKIQKNQILPQGKYPVITQETDKLISGYTNIDEPIIDLPLIVFGDHSCSFKYIDFKFIRGADGTQLLKPDNRFNIKFFYYILRSITIENQEKYQRHMKYLKQAKIPIPPLATQKEIVQKIEKIEAKIKQNENILKESKTKKEEVLKSYL